MADVVTSDVVVQAPANASLNFTVSVVSPLSPICALASIVRVKPPAWWGLFRRPSRWSPAASYFYIHVFKGPHRNFVEI
jgi:hypothetical protein